MLHGAAMFAFVFKPRFRKPWDADCIVTLAVVHHQTLAVRRCCGRHGGTATATGHRRAEGLNERALLSLVPDHIEIQILGLLFELYVGQRRQPVPVFLAPGRWRTATGPCAGTHLGEPGHRLLERRRRWLSEESHGAR
jgi:hypothetical protein